LPVLISKGDEVAHGQCYELAWRVLITLPSPKLNRLALAVVQAAPDFTVRRTIDLCRGIHEEIRAARHVMKGGAS
jgi:hypothetical protein